LEFKVRIVGRGRRFGGQHGVSRGGGQRRAPRNHQQENDGGENDWHEKMLLRAWA
jgi:hypothetical protein